VLKSWNPRRPTTNRDLADKWLGDGDDDLPAISDLERPKTRGDCVDGPRPCPWVGCRYSLYLDVNPKNGVIKFNHPALEVEELVESCALDVADKYPDGAPLAVVASNMGLSYDRCFHTTNEGKARAREVAIEIADGPGPWVKG
jgi:hypothetical protein